MLLALKVRLASFGVMLHEGKTRSRSVGSRPSRVGGKAKWPSYSTATEGSRMRS